MTDEQKKIQAIRNVLDAGVRELLELPHPEAERDLIGKHVLATQELINILDKRTLALAR